MVPPMTEKIARKAPMLKGETLVRIGKGINSQTRSIAVFLAALTSAA